ncbi:MAG: hypothetical protein OEV00_02900 [Acidobacteriota bacterium]|nr:hypothetical protein [Acidobacteriota bacterium]MDH3784258.1 hypothetical protein [Acidobacteriota bacterium]
MDGVRAALAQIAPKLGDIDANLDLHLEWVAKAADQGARLICFPELSLTGYHLLDQVPEVALPTDHPTLKRLADASRRIDIVAGFVEQGAGYKFFNSAGYFSGGELCHLHRKLYLPTYGMFQEGREFAEGQQVRHFDGPIGPTGLLICEDLWHGSVPWILAQQGAEILIVPSNSPTRGAKPDRGVTSVDVWGSLLGVTAQFQTCWVIFVNRVGSEDGLIFGGGSMAVNPFGVRVASAPALEESLTMVDIDAGSVRRARTAYPLLRDERLDLADREIQRIRRLRYDLPDEES